MLSFALIFVASLFFTGIVVRVKSLASGRKGPGVFQPIRDIWRLLRKGAVYSRTSSLVFQLAPSVYFASILAAIAVVPLGSYGGIISFSCDFVFFAYVLALGKFFCIIAALDTGSSFEGMGASREALFSMLAEPAFFILMGTLGLLTGHTSFLQIFSGLHIDSNLSYILVTIACFLLIMICMIENSRMPVDDPKTHLELTMIHEVMILDNSGFDLGLILHATNLKFAMYGALIANLFIGNMPLWPAVAAFFGIQIATAVVAGIIESFMARFRMGHNSQFILVLSSLALLMLLGVMLIIN
ncbi:MAG: NADH-quinone oxidoreductase subunit H [Salinivirgaceae bacterium]|nr:NADH-quinone oxidoreductase subunit H [Salinivirgaceae bacterium]